MGRPRPISSFTESIRIDAPTSDVWRVLNDIGRIADWHPGKIDSRMLGDTTHGPGAERRCTISARHWLEERVVEHQPPHSITFRLVRSTLPFDAADIGFVHAEAEHHTLVDVSPVYRLRFGPMGKLLDLVVVRASYRRAMRGLLSGLKRRVESDVLNASGDGELISTVGGPLD